MPSVTIATTVQDTARPYRMLAFGGTPTDIVKDGNDATWMRRASAGSPAVYYRLAAPSIPDGSDIATCVPGARIHLGPGGLARVLRSAQVPQGRRSQARRGGTGA